MANPISKNQYNFLTNMSNGKTAAGATARPGEVGWAKNQLSSSIYKPVSAQAAAGMKTPMPSTPAASPRSFGTAGVTPYSAATAKPASTQFGVPSSRPSGITNQSTPTPMSANTIGSPGMSTGTYGSRQTTPAAYGVIPVRGLTDNQRSAQKWINNSGRHGSMKEYTQNNYDKYYRGEISQEALMADASRVGYGLPGDMQFGTMAETLPEPAPVDYNALASGEFASQLATLKSQADQQIASLTSGWDASNATLKDNRVLDDLKFERNNSPFEGRTNYAQGLIGRERTMQDANAQNQYNSNVAAINQGYSDAQSKINEQIAARAYQLEQEAIQRAQDAAALTGTYQGAPTMAAQSMAFNQNMDSQKFAYQQARDSIADKRYQAEFDLNNQHYGLEYALKQAMQKHQISNDAAQNAISSMNAQTSRMNAGTSAASLSWSKDPKNPDNIYKNAQIDSLNNKPNSTTSVNAKDSANNLSQAKSYVDSMTKDQAKQYASGVSNYLSDSDYRALMNYIDSNL